MIGATNRDGWSPGTGVGLGMARWASGQHGLLPTAVQRWAKGTREMRSPEQAYRGTNPDFQPRFSGMISVMHGMGSSDPLNPLDEAIQTAKDRASTAGWFMGGILLLVLVLAFRPRRR